MAGHLADRDGGGYAVRLTTHTGLVFAGRTRHFQAQGDFAYCFQAYERAQRYNRLLGWWSIGFVRNFVAMSRNRQAATELCSLRLDHARDQHSRESRPTN